MKFSNKNLDDIIKALRKKIILRIGIMGSDAQTEHEGSGLTNAQLGTIHEQPDNDGKKIPKRSFLLEPLQEKLNLTTDENKYLRKELFKRYFDDKAPEKFYKALGTKALQIVDQAFMKKRTFNKFLLVKSILLNLKRNVKNTLKITRYLLEAAL